MKEIVADQNLIAYCGLYCGACGSYLRGRCPGCHENAKAKWCKVRTCCLDHQYHSCADCREFSDPNRCGHFHNFFFKLMALVFNSNRRACVFKVRELGLDGYAAFMTGRKIRTLPRRGGTVKAG